MMTLKFLLIVLMNLIKNGLMNLMKNKLKLNIMIVSFSEKQIYLNKCIKFFFKPENYKQKEREKVFRVGKKSLKWEVRS